MFFCDTELPMYNYDREKRAVSETFSRSLSELPDERQSAVLISEDPTFLSMKQVCVAFLVSLRRSNCCDCL